MCVCLVGLKKGSPYTSSVMPIEYIINNKLATAGCTCSFPYPPIHISTINANLAFQIVVNRLSLGKDCSNKCINSGAHDPI